MLMGGDLDIIYQAPHKTNDTMSVRLENHRVAIRYSIGGVLDYALSDWVSMQGKFAFRMLGATALDKTRFWCISPVNGIGDTATFNDSYDLDLGFLGIDMLGRFQLARDSWYALAGFGMSALITSNVDASQEITSSNQCQFTIDNRNTVLFGPVAGQEDIDAEEDLVGGRFDLRAGIGTFFPIGDKGWVLAPELTVGIPLNAVVDPATHDIQGIRSKEPPAQFYASLSLGLKFPWGNDPAAPALEDAPKEQVIGVIELRKGGTLKGRVLDANGNPINDAKIVVIDLGTNAIVIEDTTGISGDYSVYIKDAGRYSVSADADGYLFGSTLFEVDTEGRLVIESGDIKLAPTTNGRVRLLVFFETNSATLQASSYPELNRAAQLMRANPNMEVEIAGYSDAQGSDNYNRELSQKRANSVRDYIIGQGIPSARLVAIGYGEQNPIATNDTDDGRAKNRRVEFVVRRK
jgi:outer membrane protein OmpA-like peptidoglycan-associated protein